MQSHIISLLFYTPSSVYNMLQLSPNTMSSNIILRTFCSYYDSLHLLLLCMVFSIFCLVFVDDLFDIMCKISYLLKSGPFIHFVALPEKIPVRFGFGNARWILFFSSEIDSCSNNNFRLKSAHTQNRIEWSKEITRKQILIKRAIRFLILLKLVMIAEHRGAIHETVGIRTLTQF